MVEGVRYRYRDSHQGDCMVRARLHLHLQFVLCWFLEKPSQCPLIVSQEVCIIKTSPANSVLNLYTAPVRTSIFNSQSPVYITFMNYIGKPNTTPNTTAHSTPYHTPNPHSQNPPHHHHQQSPFPLLDTTRLLPLLLSFSSSPSHTHTLTTPISP